jgi:hypothetical protein
VLEDGAEGVVDVGVPTPKLGNGYPSTPAEGLDRKLGEAPLVAEVDEGTIKCLAAVS